MKKGWNQKTEYTWNWNRAALPVLGLLRQDPWTRQKSQTCLKSTAPSATPSSRELSSNCHVSSAWAFLHNVRKANTTTLKKSSERFTKVNCKAFTWRGQSQNSKLGLIMDSQATLSQQITSGAEPSIPRCLALWILKVFIIGIVKEKLSIYNLSFHILKSASSHLTIIFSLNNIEQTRTSPESRKREAKACHLPVTSESFLAKGEKKHHQLKEWVLVCIQLLLTQKATDNRTWT